MKTKAPSSYRLAPDEFRNKDSITLPLYDRTSWSAIKWNSFFWSTPTFTFGIYFFIANKIFNIILKSENCQGDQEWLVVFTFLYISLKIRLGRPNVENKKNYDYRLFR